MNEQTTGSDDGDPLSQLREQLGRLQRYIWTRRPILGEIMQSYGGMNLYQYAQGFHDTPETPALGDRRRELIQTARDLIAARLGDRVAQDVADQLRRSPVVSTTDHHGPIDHPFFVNANLISTVAHLERPALDLRHLVVFSFASISVNNASAYPRGILFHGGDHGEGELIRLPILPDRVKMSTVYGVRPLDANDLERSLGRLTSLVQKGQIGSKRAGRIATLLRGVFGRADVLAALDFASQISVINYHLWPQLFPTTGTRSHAGLVYLEIETLVTELLLRHHLTQTSSSLTRLITDAAFHASALQHFNNISGAFSTERDWGTFLFWALDEKLRRVRLFLRDGHLVSQDASVTIALEPRAVADALAAKRIFPSMALCYTVVALHYGMQCLGGFSQVNDLTKTKDAWASVLRTHGEDAEAERFQSVRTTILGGDGMVLAYQHAGANQWFTATGIDLAVSDDAKSLHTFLELAKRVTLSEMMQPMLPEMYRVFYAQEERDPELATLQSEHIIHANGFRTKLQRVLMSDQTFPERITSPTPLVGVPS